MRLRRFTASFRTVTLALLVAGCQATPEAQRRPNILLFLVDDLGWQDTSLALHTERTKFNARYRTPHLERLAARGVAFTNAYAASPVCTPTRAAILTGQHPARTRITNWTLEGDRSAPHPSLATPDWNLNGLSNAPNSERAWCAPTLPALLGQAGYRTLHVGKAHYGALQTSGADPCQLGFDVNVAGHAAGGPGSYLGQQNYSASWRGGSDVWDVPDLEAYHGTDTFLTEALTLETERLLDQVLATDQPFFLQLAHYAVHVPFAADERFAGPYRQLLSEPAAAAELAGDEPSIETEAQYAALVEGYDASLGRILQKLADHGALEHTLVIFCSDNGGLSAHGRGGPPNTHNAPLASGKGSGLEGGLRVPLVVAGPTVAGSLAGTRCDEAVIATDLFTTVLRAAQLSAEVWSERQDLDAQDLTPLLQNGPDSASSWPERALFWHYPHQWGAPGPGIEPFSAIRRGPWKLIHFYADGRRELYHLERDIGETEDQQERYPEVANALERELGEQLRALRAQTPIERSSGVSRPFPGSR